MDSLEEERRLRIKAQDELREVREQLSRLQDKWMALEVLFVCLFVSVRVELSRGDGRSRNGVRKQRRN